ncbi:hypothetical protein [Roseibium sediminis]|uniref:hypothetical protein n=1 Tax=Roseibium sediminis TaxID=1775174 RepID=UPI001AD8E194|nr:hypothetical protein [Roseibium sediminis]
MQFLRVDPVSALGRSTVRRKRRSVAETETERFAPRQPEHLPVATQAPEPIERVDLNARYRPNSVFLAHLIATRDQFPQTRYRRQREPEHGADVYRATAARPRQREVGHVVSTEL